MTKVHIPDCGKGQRPDPYQCSDQGLRLGSALRVPASPIGGLVGRPFPAYQRPPEQLRGIRMNLGINLSYTDNHSLHRGYNPLCCGSRAPLFYLPILVKGRGKMSS
jgi:hypothetical protein